MLAPPRLQVDTFKDDQGREIRYAFSSPETPPKAIVTLLEGRAEPLEKYKELIKDFNDNGYACAIMDWPGQGKSYRNLPDFPQRHDIPDFDVLVETLGVFRREIVPSLFPGNELPYAMFGQSMGAYIGMRYMASNPNDYSCATLSAPMLRFNPIPKYQFPDSVDPFLIFIGGFGKQTDYFLGGQDWSPEHEAEKSNYLTTDKERGQKLTTLFTEDPELQVGSWTRRTLKGAFHSNSSFLKETVETPCLILLGENDRVVKNQVIKSFAARQPHMEVIEIKDALHELYMERDKPRDQFLGHAFSFMDRHIPKPQ